MTAASRSLGARFGARPLDLAFLALWAVCVAVHGYGGPRSDFVFSLAEGAVLGVLYFVTRRFTDRPAEPLHPPARSALAGILVAAVIVLPFAGALGFTVAGRALDMSAWFAFVRRVAELLQYVLPLVDRDSLANFTAMALFPGIVLFVLGWRARDLGFGRSRRGTLRALVLWSSVPVVVYGVAAFAIGHGKPAVLLHRWIVDVFRNGFAEEILWRGIVLRLLVAPLGITGATVVQALGFGLWHLPADLRETHGVLWNALADCIATQGLNGYAMGQLRLRTGNVLVPGVFHALIDGGTVFG